MKINICYKCKRPITTGKLCEACKMKIKYHIRPEMRMSKKKYSYDNWKRKQLALSKITLGEFLMDMCNSGKPLANLYLEKCPIIFKSKIIREVNI